MSDAAHLVGKEERATPSAHRAKTLFAEVGLLELSLMAEDAFEKPQIGGTIIDSLSVLEFTKHTVSSSQDK
jgi:hypothetical protein